jgi:2-dehydropantoate 2-reductase
LQADLWHLLGAGSLGTLAASRLCAAGISLKVIGRSGTTLQRTLLWPDGQVSHLMLEPAADEPIRHLLVAVKAGDTRSALLPLLTRLHPDVEILLLQNGMGALDTVPLPAGARVFHLVTTDGAFRQQDQVTVVAQNQTLLGDGSSSPPDWLASLQPHWPGLRWCQDIARVQWQKLAVNAVINPLTALYRCRNGELLDGGERQLYMAQLANEVDRLLAHLYPDWCPDTLERSIVIARQTAANTSSMLADVLAGRRTELAYINGYLLQQARHYHLSLPTHEQLVRRLEPIDARAPNP